MRWWPTGPKESRPAGLGEEVGGRGKVLAQERKNAFPNMTKDFFKVYSNRYLK